MFVAPNITNIDAARQNAKRERAWQSILNDADLRDNLTRAQTSDAERGRRSQRSLCPLGRGAPTYAPHAPLSDDPDVDTIFAIHVYRGTCRTA